MSSKIKGLLMGILIGVLISGSLAYAGGAPLDVYLRNWIIKIDGVQKQPKEKEVLIYNNRTYIPIRFMAEIMGKDVSWEQETSTIWVGNKGDMEPIATYMDKKVLKEEFNHYLAIIKFLNPQYEVYMEDIGFLEYVLKHMIGYKILSAQADESTLEAAKVKANLELTAIKKNMNIVVGSEDAFTQKLLENHLEEADILNYLHVTITSYDLFEQKVSEEQISEQYAKSLASDEFAYTFSTIAHILIGVSDQTGQELRTKAEALVIANEVRAKLSEGTSFTQLVEDYSDDPGSVNNGGAYVDQPVNNWVLEFKEAVLELPLDTYSEPVETDFGYHIIRVDALTTKSFDDVSAEIRSSIGKDKINEFFNTELPSLIQSMKIPTP